MLRAGQPPSQKPGQVVGKPEKQNMRLTKDEIESDLEGSRSR